MPLQPPDLDAIFREEVSDWLATFEEALAALNRPRSTPEDHLGALRTIRRGLHTLKGAAGAMDATELERLFHHLEDELPPAQAPVDPRAVTLRTEEALDSLRTWLARAGAEAAPPPPSPTQPMPNLDAGTVRVPSDKLAYTSSLGEMLLNLATQSDPRPPGEPDVDEVILEVREFFARHLRDDRDQRSARALTDRLRAWLMDRKREAQRRDAALLNLSSQISTAIRNLRAVPFGALTPLLERAAQQAAADLGRQVEIEVSGEQEQLDRRVAERLREALVHLIRNAVDHGIEPPDERSAKGKAPVGRIEVRAQTHGTEVSLTVGDDGRGIDLERLRGMARARGLPSDSPDAVLDLVFEPYITTRDRPTATSGRGVGLDVVRQIAHALQGRIEVDPRPGRGARFRLTVTADLGVAAAIVVWVGGWPYAIRGGSVHRSLLVRPEMRRLVSSRPHLLWEGQLIPLVDAQRLLGHETRAPTERPHAPALLLDGGRHRVALLVDEVVGMKEIVVKPLGPRIRGAGFLTGLTLLEGGQVVCVLDGSQLARFARAPAPQAPTSRRRSARILVVDDAVTTRQLLASILRAAGYRVEQAAQGEEAWRMLNHARELPDLVVSDIEMPRVDGFQLLARMRGSPQTADLPLVLITARSDDADRRRAMELGADAYIVKGRFDQTTLLDTVAELLP